MKKHQNLLLKKSLLIVAVFYLLYNIYQAATTTVFVAHFPMVITRLPTLISSSQPSLQLGLFLFQEIAGSAGSYLRLAASIFAVYSSILFLRNNVKYYEIFGRVVLLESIYFLLLLPSAVNHLVGSVISSSDFLNFYTGVSVLLQGVFIFPVLFFLSRKIEMSQGRDQIFRWACIAAPFYVLGFWVRHGLFWVYALSGLAIPGAGFAELVGFVNSWLTLLSAAIVSAIICFLFWQKKEISFQLVGVALILVGVYFVIYDLVSVWQPIYLAFFPLTDFWMASLLILGIAMLLKRDNWR
jgi:hypothetical protein